MLRLASKYYHTIKYLRWTQIAYQLRNLVQSHTIPYTLKKTPTTKSIDIQNLRLLPSIPSYKSLLSPNDFQFLNIEKRFSNKINWNFSGHGKLWTYNLNYFEYLNQPDLKLQEGLRLINDFIDQQEKIEDGMEPFPISLRVISWLKFIITNKIDEERIKRSLRRQLEVLRKNPEYHLLGNHLLENAFALLFGGCYFNDKEMLQQAKRILTTQMPEQILPDGGHFELSPMYHQLILFRVLDSINLLQNNGTLNQGDLLDLLREKAGLMLSWLKNISFADGGQPRVNDSTTGVAPDAQALFAYADRLNIAGSNHPLAESGYRKIKKPAYEMLVDIGQIGPDYIPGHAHSDTFNFVLHHRGNPLIVDTGISTYEKNEKRQLERSTAAHNTVSVADRDQSEVWGGFRVARRAKVNTPIISEDRIQASHNGYKRMGVTHQRTFTFSDSSILIADELSRNVSAKAFFHFLPGVKIQQTGDKVVGDFGQIEFESAESIDLEDYDYAHGFNNTEPAKKITVKFEKELRATILLQ